MSLQKNIKIKQRDITDCGAACLASVAAFYKLKLPVSRIRQYAGTDKRGTNVLGLIEAAELLGFQATTTITEVLDEVIPWVKDAIYKNLI